MALEDRDRDMIVRVEQNLANANQNQLQILEDLRTIFNRLEQESKVVMVISGDLKAHLESSPIRWNNIDKQLAEISRRLAAVEERNEQTTKDIVSEREERTKSVTIEREERAKANQNSENFEREVKASVRTVGWLIGALASIATIISVFSIFVHK